MSDIMIRGSKPNNYGTLLYHLKNFRVNFLTLRFAQMMFTDIIEKGLRDNNYNPSKEMYHGDAFEAEKGNFDESKFKTYDLQNYMIGDILKPLIDVKGGNINSVITVISLQNFHFLRTKFINGIYEILEKYVEKYEELCKGENKKSHLRNELQKQDWYVILYFLRNNASHADTLQKPIKFVAWVKKLNKETITWKDIYVKEGMVGHSIRYNDDELLELSL